MSRPSPSTYPRLTLQHREDTGKYHGGTSTPDSQDPQLASPNDVGYTNFSPVVTGTSLFESAPLEALPQPPVLGATCSETPTPLTEHAHPDLGLESLIADDLFSTLVPLPDLPAHKHNLRLPSFDALGIAAPHPDRKSANLENLFTPLGAGPLSKPEDPLHSSSPALARSSFTCGTAHRGELPTSAQEYPHTNDGRVGHLISTVTPPADDHQAVDWSNGRLIMTAAMESPAATDPEMTTPSIEEASSTQRPAADPLPQAYAPPSHRESWSEKALKMISTYEYE